MGEGWGFWKRQRQSSWPPMPFCTVDKSRPKMNNWCNMSQPPFFPHSNVVRSTVALTPFPSIMSNNEHRCPNWRGALLMFEGIWEPIVLNEQHRLVQRAVGCSRAELLCRSIREMFKLLTLSLFQDTSSWWPHPPHPGPLSASVPKVIGDPDFSWVGRPLKIS